ncbi:MAG: dehypoxanthine futalosine cyclase [Draconibacterium sp.]|nr:MAG: dehypoxanthine futalosine cyclase [Draconibacterium sp.]
MNTETIIKKALELAPLSLEEGMVLYERLPLNELMLIAGECREKHVPGREVGWIIDRNINITNVCISGCKFCNFHCKISEDRQYITTMDEYEKKIDGLIAVGGKQVLLQGGMHPKLGVDFYVRLFSDLKSRFPNVKLHALGPPEVAFLARKGRLSYREVLEKLVEAGMDSLPGAGAEILSDRVRKAISPGKCSTGEWLDVMREAHKMNLVTSATMMFGHIESKEERLQHLIRLREVQAEKPQGAHGFVTFVPWPFMDEYTVLRQEGTRNTTTAGDYIRLVAISRIMLNNVKNLQASWLTVGAATGQLCLYAGANDFGSIMMEENVVSAAGANYTLNATGIQQAIRDAGFLPRYRNQAYEDDILPEKVTTKEQTYKHRAGKSI